jgi:hypothetical protein
VTTVTPMESILFWKRWTRRRKRMVIRVALIFFGLATGYTITILVNEKHYGRSSAVFVLLVAVTLLEFVFVDYFAERRYPHETEKILTLLEERLGHKTVEVLREKLDRTIDTFRACEKERISATVHVIVNLTATAESVNRRGLMQLTDYVGYRGGQKGRITPLERGVIGRCARTGRTESVNFADDAEYLTRMVREFGYSVDETELHTKSARSYLAHPVLSAAGVPLGVLYFFSTEPQIFPGAAKETNLVAVAKDIRGLLQTGSIV